MEYESTISLLARVHGLEVGQHVEKFTGEARWTGWIVAAYYTRRGSLRVVVDVEPQGFQMITVPEQLRAIGEQDHG